MNYIANIRTESLTIGSSDFIDTISCATAACALGHILIASSSKGVCAILIGETAEELKVDLDRRFAASVIHFDEHALSDDLEGAPVHRRPGPWSGPNAQHARHAVSARRLE